MDRSRSDELQRLEAEARGLDTSATEIEPWLADVARFTRDYLAGNVTGPAYRPLGDGVPLSSGVPAVPTSFSAVLDEFANRVLARGIVPTSGRFFGYVPGGALPSAAIGDYLAALTNRYSGVYAAAPGAAEIENDAVIWLCEMIGYPDTAWGTLQSGGSLATLAAVVAAREARPRDQWDRGVFYRTPECHYAIDKALHIAGLSHIPVREIAVDRELRMSVADLANRIAADERAGLVPWIVFASAGTVNTGAIDPLEPIADVARAAGAWLHVDGAYGGLFVLTERARDALTAMARADSVVLDPHKGMFLPYGCGAVLVRNGEFLRRGFSPGSGSAHSPGFSSSYLADVRHDAPSPADYSPELTRHFRGLRLWMSLKVHGLGRFVAALEEKLLLAEIAQQRLGEIPGIETGPAPQLSIAAFRVAGEGDGPTEALLARLLERGRVHLSSTRLWGKLYVRICVLCFRSHREDLDVVLDEIVAALPVVRSAS